MPSGLLAWRQPRAHLHRRRRGVGATILDGLAGLLVISAVFGGFGLLLGYAQTRDLQPWAGVGGAAFGLALVTAATFGNLRLLRVKYAWARAHSAGWSPTPARSWAWDVRRNAANVGETVVQFAQSRVYRGYPVTLLSVGWNNGGLGTLGTTISGGGLVVVMTLPEAYGPAGVVRRSPADRLAADPFDRTYRAIDSERLRPGENSQLRDAYAAGGHPPWVIEGDEFYAYLGALRLPLPDQANTLIESALGVLDMLGIPAPGV